MESLFALPVGTITLITEVAGVMQIDLLCGSALNFYVEDNP